MERRRSPRQPVSVDCTLTRRRGNPVQAHTEDLGSGGMRVTTERPLAVDEELLFEIEMGGERRDGRARVLREQGLNCYALRFESAVDDIYAWVSRTT